MCGVWDVAAERGWKLGTLDHMGRVQSYLRRRRLLFHATLWQPTVSRQSKPEQNWTGPYLVHLTTAHTHTSHFYAQIKTGLITQHQLGHTVKVRSHLLVFSDFVCQLFCGQNPVISIGIHAIWNFLWGWNISQFSNGFKLVMWIRCWPTETCMVWKWILCEFLPASLHYWQ